METEVLEAKLPEIKEFNTSLVDRASQLACRIIDRPTLEEAVNHGREIDRRLKWMEEFFEPLVSSAHKTWRMLTSRREDAAGPLRQAKLSLSSAIGYFKTQEEKKRMAEEARIRAELQSKVEDDTLKMAAALESAGQKEAAQALMEAPVVTPPIILPKQTKTEGTYTRTNWKFTISDEAKIPRQYLIPDIKKIGMVVRTMKDKTDIPGVAVSSEAVEAFRS